MSQPRDSEPPAAAAPLRRWLAAAVLAALAAGAPAQELEELNRIVLRVNDTIATLLDYERRKAERVATIARSELPAEQRQKLLAEVGRDTLRAIFEELLLTSRAKQLGLNASPEELQRAVEDAKRNFGLETEADFEVALAQSGMTREMLLDQFRENIEMQKVLGREVQPRVELAEEDLRRYYRAHPEEFVEPRRLRLREIVFLDSSGRPVDELERLAEELAADVLAGEEVDAEVAELAAEGLATEWIDLGWVESGELAEDLERAVWNLDAGGVSEPVAGRGGVHLLEVLERQERRTREFNEVKDQIAATLSDRVFQEELAAYLLELEEASYIESRPPPEAADFRTARADAPLDPLRELDRALTAPLAAPPPTVPPPPAAAGDEGP